MSRRIASRPSLILLAALLGALLLLVEARASTPHGISLDGVIDEPEWALLGTSGGGPAPGTGFGDGHELHALYAYNDATYLYLGVAGNVQHGHHILLFIDSRIGGYTTATFGRAGAPPGLDTFNPGTTFDAAFSPDYALVIGTNASHDNYTWDLYTLSASGGPATYLGDNSDADLHAAPLNASLTHGFETRLTFNSPGTGVDLSLNQNYVKLLAVYIADDGALNNQFITPALPNELPYGSGPINFSAAAPNNVDYQVVGVTGSATGLVISEFQARGVNGANDEFIELYNPTTAPINFDGWKLNVSTSAGITNTVVILSAGVSLNPGCHYLVTNRNTSGGPYSGLIPGHQTYTSGIPDNGGLALVRPNNTLADQVGLSAGSLYKEGAPLAAFQLNQDQSYERSPGGAVGSSQDTANNSADFTFRTPSDPQNLASPCITFASPATASPTVTATPTWTSTPPPTSSGTSTPPPTSSVTPTPSPTVTATAPAPATFTSTPTRTATATATSTATVSSPLTPSPSPTLGQASQTPTPTPSLTPSPSPTSGEGSRTPTVTPTALRHKPAIWRNGSFYLRQTLTSGGADLVFGYGANTDIPLICDWDGNGSRTVGVYRPANSVFFLRNTNDTGIADIAILFGLPSDVPVCGDWNGDGTETVGIFRSSTAALYLRNSNTSGYADLVFLYGIPGDIFIAGDWNGDSVDTVGIRRGTTWFLKNTNGNGNADLFYDYGISSDVPIQGDWDHDGAVTAGVYRAGVWYLRNSHTSGTADQSFNYGAPGDTPLVWR